MDAQMRDWSGWHEHPMWGTIQQFDKFRATFAPQRTDDLKPGAAEWVGRESTWEAYWIIEEGPYAGDRAMAPDFKEGWPFVWAPHRDLTGLELVEESPLRFEGNTREG